MLEWAVLIPLATFLYWHCLLDHAHSQRQRQEELLAFIEALDDPEIAFKLARMISKANKDLVDHISTLPQEVRSLRSSLQERDTTIAESRSEVQLLHDDLDALEQHGKRHSLRISGIRMREEDTTAAVVKLGNEVLEIAQPMSTKDISVCHRLQTPRNARANEPAPIIVRFVSRADKDRVIRERKQLKDMNTDETTKVYINEDFPTRRANIFSMARSLQKRKLFKQTWTYNGRIEVMMPNGDIKTASNFNELQALVPNETLQ